MFDSVTLELLKEIKEKLRCDVGNIFLMRLCAGLMAYHEENEEYKKLLEDIELADRIASINENIKRKQECYTKELVELEDKKGNFQNSCNHVLTWSYPDSSENNDSSRLCLGCGKYF